ncbi:MAG: TIGR04282 family arsenosugar biosynthesis glycosyltransferase [Magnetococcales bacterium]|nr:TIGR04282 family arsenosugar biosynthesis glycosyltransferase [Magnetococcales bacterium]
MLLISLNLLGKAPLPGYAKTRLIPRLGPEGAAEAQIALLTHVAGVARSWCQAKPERRFNLWCAPDCHHTLFQQVAPEGHLFPQPPGHLGERLQVIADYGLKEARGVLLLGGDGVSMTGAVLDQAEAILKNNQALLAPSEDGGYVLLGLTQTSPDLFSHIPWGSDRVAQATRSKFQALGWPWVEIPGQWDVDTPGDWERFSG